MKITTYLKNYLKQRENKYPNKPHFITWLTSNEKYDEYMQKHGGITNDDANRLFNESQTWLINRASGGQRNAQIYLLMLQDLRKNKESTKSNFEKITLNFTNKGPNKLLQTPQGSKGGKSDTGGNS